MKKIKQQSFEERRSELARVMAGRFPGRVVSKVIRFGKNPGLRKFLRSLDRFETTSRKSRFVARTSI